VGRVQVGWVGTTGYWCSCAGGALYNPASAGTGTSGRLSAAQAFITPLLQVSCPGSSG
jgi:hypothetical protein